MFLIKWTVSVHGKELIYSLPYRALLWSTSCRDSAFPGPVLSCSFAQAASLIPISVPRGSNPWNRSSKTDEVEYFIWKVLNDSTRQICRSRCWVNLLFRIYCDSEYSAHCWTLHVILRAFNTETWSVLTGWFHFDRNFAQWMERYLLLKDQKSLEVDQSKSLLGRRQGELLHTREEPSSGIPLWPGSSCQEQIPLMTILDIRFFFLTTGFLKTWHGYMISFTF